MWRYFSPLLDEEGKWTVVTNVLDTESNRNELVYIEKEQQKKLEVDSASIDETDVVDGLTAVRYLVTNTEDVAVENMILESDWKMEARSQKRFQFIWNRARAVQEQHM